MVSKTAGDPSQMKWCHKATRFVAVRCAPKKKRAIRDKNEGTCLERRFATQSDRSQPGPRLIITSDNICHIKCSAVRRCLGCPGRRGLVLSFKTQVAVACLLYSERRLKSAWRFGAAIPRSENV
jgi:hypothetical protein